MQSVFNALHPKLCINISLSLLVQSKKEPVNNYLLLHLHGVYTLIVLGVIL